MSAKYTFLAWDTPVKEASTKLALLQLANNADDNGFSYYSISKMAKSCDMSDRTFMRKIQNLEKLGVLTVERRANRQSLYTLIGDEMGVTICHLQNNGVTDCHAEVTGCHVGVTELQAGGDKLSYDPNNTPNNIPDNAPDTSEFSKFWELYNKKTDTKKCEAKFKKLTKPDVDLLFAALPSYITSTPDKKFRKNPLTWLNGKCWNDEVIAQSPTQRNINEISKDFSAPEGFKPNVTTKWEGGR